MNAESDEKIEILREIRDGVRLIAAAMAEPLRKRVESEFLTSDQRKRMYQEFNGAQSYEDVARKVKVTAEAVRVFAVALEQAGLLVLAKQGSKTCPKRILSPKVARQRVRAQ